MDLKRKREAHCCRRCRGGPVAAYRRRVGCGCGSLLGRARGWPESEECDPHGSSSNCSHLSQRGKRRMINGDEKLLFMNRHYTERLLKAAWNKSFY